MGTLTTTAASLQEQDVTVIWAFLSRRFRLWVLFAVGIPLVRRLLGGAGDALEARKGQNALSRGMQGGSQYLTRYERKTRRRARR